ncbi:MAG: hypothetical protein C5B50_02080, partial [Verrucomicrobia bacterium]
VTQLASSITASNATLNATVDPQGQTSTWYFQYGLSTNYGSSTITNTLGSTSSALPVSSVINGLASATLYNYRIVAANVAGTSFGTNMTFSTAAARPILTTLPASSVTTSAATLNATVNPNGAVTTVNFQYGPTTNYGSTSSSVTLPATNAVFSTNIVISGLSPGALYHFRAVGANSAGTTNGADLTFTNLPSAPSVTTLAASNFNIGSAQLGALINPNGAATTLYFRYGPDTNYGSFSPTNSVGSGTTPLVGGATIGGLSILGTYHFQAVAANSVGTSNGADQAFTIPLPARTLIPVGITNTSAMLTAAVITNVMPATAWFQWGLGTNLNQVTSATTNLLPGSAAAPVALHFNAPSVVNVPSNAVPLGNSSYTIEAWIYPEASGNLGIIGWGPYGTSNQVTGFRLNGSAVENYWWANDLIGTNSNPPNQWHHAAATFDGTNRIVYLDGNVVGQDAPVPGHNVPNSSNLTIGRSAPGEYFQGRINEVRVWNFARSQAALQSQMSLPLTGQESGLVGYWPLQDGSGNVATDGTGHNYNGTLVTSGVTWQPASDQPLAPEFSLPLANLQADTLYSCRVVVSNSSGVFAGNTVSFTTAPTIAANPPYLMGATGLSDGTFQFSFTNTPGAHFTVFSTTNITLPFSNWTVLTNVVESPAGQFHFTDPGATTNAQRFYRVRSP